MNFAVTLKAAILALVCGVTEFLPVSSNGHVIILKELLGFEGPSGKTFEMSLQMGAILAVCFLYRAKLIHTALYILRNRTDQRFVINLILGFLPAAMLGFVFHHFITEHLFNVWIVGVMLVLGGIIMLAVEKGKPAPATFSIDTITPKQALLIGIIQALALIPGVSRSGATIMGAMVLKVERKIAAEFSFLLAIPIIFSASLYDFFVHRHEVAGSGIGLLVTGFVIAFVSALVVVKWLLGYLSRHDFRPFAWYRIAVGLMLMFVLVIRNS